MGLWNIFLGHPICIEIYQNFTLNILFNSTFINCSVPGRTDGPTKGLSNSFYFYFLCGHKLSPEIRFTDFQQTARQRDRQTGRKTD